MSMHSVRRAIAVSLSVPLLGLSPMVSANAPPRAVQAIRKGDFKSALSELRPVAERGDPDAQLLLSMLYDSGKGVPQDQAIAASWYRKAAEQKHLVAQLYLGV